MREYDDESARSLLGMLADDVPPPSRVDIGALVRTGRRRARRRRLAGVAATVLVTVGAVAVVPVVVDVANRSGQERPVVTGGAAQPEEPPLQPAVCTPHQLPLPGPAVSSEVLGGDPSGRYLVGMATDKLGQSYVVRWDRGQLTTLKVPIYQPAHLVVNARGDVAGDGYLRETKRTTAWVYRDDQFTQLPTGGGVPVAVVGINERGDVLGTIQGGTVAPSPHPSDIPAGKFARTYGTRPVIWPASSVDDVRALANPPGASIVSVVGIDDDGTAVGTSTAKPVTIFGNQSADLLNVGARGLVWAPDGTVRELAAPPGYGPEVAIQSIRNGWVIGSYRSPSDGTVTARWNLRTGDVRPLSLKFVTSVNRYGWVGGYVIDASGGFAQALATDERTLVLPLAEGFDRSRPTAIKVLISDNGQQIGSVLEHGGRGTPAAFRWSCV
ncbi:hypothetical protein OG792_03460 [Micromonospora sp. NBC_01699]|uniref:hypothetical protein n=1 Tax=Micromonospora sp. NBC_01699 TaxID=2975984 RepID=UPI002E2C3423|nr:hypothetical protein [Micromonospora sp. NBC_01699]